VTGHDRNPWQSRIGQQLGTSDWFVLEQPAVDAHAALTGDDDWVHTDPDRVRAEGLFDGAPIVQGSLLLAQLVRLSHSLPRPAEVRYALNYGFDRVRFVSPLKVGTPVRATFVLADAVPHAAGVLTSLDVTFATDAATVAVARWRGLSVLA
jgi:acyl dehydratase